MLEGSFVKEKTGPLPNYAWMGMILGVALAYSLWKGRQSGGKSTDNADTDDTVGEDVAGAMPPTYAFVAGDTIVNNNMPPWAGRPIANPGPPVTTPPPVTGPIGTLPGETPIKPPTTAPTKPTPPKAPAAPKGSYVSVVKYTTKNPPWNSTLSGIASHVLGSAKLWTSIWNDPNNAKLKALRKKPELIRPGDKIWVPAKKK